MNTRYLPVVVPTLLGLIACLGGPAAYAQAPAPTAPVTSAAPATTAPAAAPHERHLSPLAAGLQAADVTAAETAQIKAIHQKYSDLLQEQMKELEEKEAAEVKALLTPDQQAKFQEQYDVAKTQHAAGGLLVALTTELNLTDDERLKIAPILASTNDAIKTLRDDTVMARKDKVAKVTATLSDARTKIRAILSPDQQTTFDTLPELGGGPNYHPEPRHKAPAAP